MAIDYNDSAVNRLRLFLWDKLKASTILDESNYIADGFDLPLIPIIPTQQIPEFNNLIGDQPYIVYNYDVAPYGEEWWVCEENITFSLISTDYGKLIQMMNFMVDLFRRMDESASDVNSFFGENTIFKFFVISLGQVSSPSPFTEEGGRMLAEVGISIKYSRFLDQNGRFE